MLKKDKAPDIQSILTNDLYADNKPQIDNIKQVLDTLRDKIQPLTPVQMQVIGYLDHLQRRPLHEGEKVYQNIIDNIKEEAHKVANPGFFIRVIEALIPRPMYLDEKAYQKMRSEGDGK